MCFGALYLVFPGNFNLPLTPLPFDSSKVYIDKSERRVYIALQNSKLASVACRVPFYALKAAQSGAPKHTYAAPPMFFQMHEGPPPEELLSLLGPTPDIAHVPTGRSLNSLMHLATGFRKLCLRPRVELPGTSHGRAHEKAGPADGERTQRQRSRSAVDPISPKKNDAQKGKAIGGANTKNSGKRGISNPFWSRIEGKAHDGW